jgi:hypothetical protein
MLGELYRVVASHSRPIAEDILLHYSEMSFYMRTLDTIVSLAKEYDKNSDVCPQSGSLISQFIKGHANGKN